MSRASLTALADRLEKKVDTPLSLVERSLEQAATSAGVFTLVMHDSALAEASASTKRRTAGCPLSRFDGIPVAVKDLFDIAGTVTTAGSRTLLSSAPASHDSPIVRKLRDSGLIVIGKTNLSEFAASGLGLNPHFGTPIAQGREAHVPGGSSSGSAIAVQRGIVPVALGTDTAGSVRIPAAFNGLVGFRPSVGRYDMTGVFPLAASFDTAGPITNNVKDCVLLDGIMRSDAVVEEVPFDRPIAIDHQFFSGVDLEPAIRGDMDLFVDRLADLGARIEERRIDAFSRAYDAITQLGWLGGIEAAALHRHRLAGPERLQIDPQIVARLDGAARLEPAIGAQLQQLRIGLTADLSAQLAGAVAVMPTVAHVAPLLEPLLIDGALFARTNLRTLSLTMVGSFLDMPGIALPLGHDSGGLPTSGLLTAASGGDRLVLNAATMWETDQ